jgi:hypothetical protein
MRMTAGDYTLFGHWVADNSGLATGSVSVLRTAGDYTLFGQRVADNSGLATGSVCV